MGGNKIIFESIDEYIMQYPAEVQERQNLVHFAANKNHVGFYPGPSGIEEFKQELLDYNGSKGAVQFPYSKPLPIELIRKIVKFRVAENNEEAEERLGKNNKG